tara:strand:+ start:372 stop:833 length:462 start_codon:yes stop_codon:yes gene_type:complete
MKKKTILLILIFFVVSSCGFKPIYSSKKTNFDLVKIETLEKNKINSKIQNNLNNISNDESINKYKLVINSNKEKRISSKDKKGNAQTLTMVISTSIKIYKENNIISDINFSEEFRYDNNSNKFDLSQYENNIENNLVDKIISNIISHILSLEA